MWYFKSVMFNDVLPKSFCCYGFIWDRYIKILKILVTYLRVLSLSRFYGELLRGRSEFATTCDTVANSNLDT